MRRNASSSQRAFTLVEVMVVVAIMGIIMTMSVPTIYRKLHPDSMRRAVSDVMEACDNARSYAVLNGVETELVIRPFDRQIRVVVAGKKREPGEDPMFSPSVSGEEWRMPEKAPAEGGSGGGTPLYSGKLGEKIFVEGLGVNGEDWTDDEEARVRFYPNGTCDEMTIVLLSENQERRNIWLEVVTGLPEFEVDPQKFKAR